MKIPEKLKSRKLWCIIVYAILVVLNNSFKLGLTEEDLWKIAIAICTYIVGESLIDIFKLVKR